MKAVFFTEQGDINSTDKIQINMKLYRLKNSYINVIDNNMAEYLKTLIGENLNNLPFIGSFLNTYNTVLLEALSEGDSVSYLFDFSTEKITYVNSSPIKVIVHKKIECKHFLQANIVVINKDKDIEDKTILSLVSLIPFYILLKLSSGTLPAYKSPKFEEIVLTIDEIFTIGTFLINIIKCNISNHDTYKVMCDKTLLKDTPKNLSIEGKYYKNTGFSIITKSPEINKKLYLYTKGEIRTDFKISSSIIDYIISLVEHIKINRIQLNLFLPINDTLDIYIDLIHKDMFNEAKQKHKIKILENFTDLIISETSACDKISYISLTILFNRLISMDIKKEALSASQDDFVFCYENLLKFIYNYKKYTYKISLNENELNILVAEFINLVKSRSADIKMFF